MNPIEKKIFFFLCKQKKKNANCHESKKILIKKIIDKIHKLIFKKLKLNVNRCIKIGKNHDLLQI
jgi:hypothetical protein